MNLDDSERVVGKPETGNLTTNPSIDRPSGNRTLRRVEERKWVYFFNSAGQFCTSVTGSVPSFRFPLLIRNFFPSAVTS